MNNRMECRITDSDLQEPGDRLDKLEDLDEDLYELSRQEEIDNTRAKIADDILKQLVEIARKT